jgi:pantetheine-phosphate adenylyltransferase
MGKLLHGGPPRKYLFCATLQARLGKEKTEARRHLKTGGSKLQMLQLRLHGYAPLCSVPAGKEDPMRTGLYAGTFDPVTLGHFDIIKRACLLVDRLVIGVAINEGKRPLFSLDERVAMVEATCDGFEHAQTEIVVHPFKNLLIDCARDVGASMIVRGLRAVSDFEHEFQMVGMNRTMDHSIETVFLMAEAKYQSIASKLVKEIASLDGDISKFVTPRVEAELLAKLGKG